MIGEQNLSMHILENSGALKLENWSMEAVIGKRTCPEEQPVARRDDQQSPQRMLVGDEDEPIHADGQFLQGLHRRPLLDEEIHRQNSIGRGAAVRQQNRSPFMQHFFDQRAAEE